MRAAVPADRLLVFRATDGWGPLCAFLGKPVPDVPYPHVNDNAEFKANIKARARGRPGGGLRPPGEE